MIIGARRYLDSGLQFATLLKHHRGDGCSKLVYGIVQRSTRRTGLENCCGETSLPSIGFCPAATASAIALFALSQLGLLCSYTTVATLAYTYNFYKKMLIDKTMSINKRTQVFIRYSSYVHNRLAVGQALYGCPNSLHSSRTRRTWGWSVGWNGA